MHDTDPPWWRGTRGEWYVVAQVALIAVVFLGPRTFPGLPSWPEPVTSVSRAAGIGSAAAGILLLLAGLFRLGSNLSPLPCPRHNATFIESGPYRFVRHPMYAGGILIAYGWALAVRGWLTLVYATVLLVFLGIKATREERWLTERFPDYPQYQQRVRKLIPFIY